MNKVYYMNTASHDSGVSKDRSVDFHNALNDPLSPVTAMVTTTPPLGNVNKTFSNNLLHTMKKGIFINARE